MKVVNDEWSKHNLCKKYGSLVYWNIISSFIFVFHKLSRLKMYFNTLNENDLLDKMKTEIWRAWCLLAIHSTHKKELKTHKYSHTLRTGPQPWHAGQQENSLRWFFFFLRREKRCLRYGPPSQAGGSDKDRRPRWRQTCPGLSHGAMPGENKDALQGLNERSPVPCGAAPSGPQRSSGLSDWPGRWPGYWNPHGGLILECENWSGGAWGGCAVLEISQVKLC